MKPMDKLSMVGLICIVAIIITGIATAVTRRTPLTPEQRIELRKQQAEEHRKGVESGQIRPSRFAQSRQQTARPQRASYIAIAVDEKYLYLLDRNGQISKIAKANIKERRQ